MATFTKHNSWGRTRSPKNLAGPPGTEITPLADTDDLLGITASTAGYATENQRYLHVLIEDTNVNNSPGAVTIFGYCHAFQRWFELSGHSEFSQTVEAEDSGDNPTAATITPAAQSTAPAAHVPSAREYRVFHLLGVDRVAFVHANATYVNIFAACSTF